jgi:hypothetical protein
MANQHAMTAHVKHDFLQLALFIATPLSPIPWSYLATLAEPNWCQAMEV